MKRRGDSLTEGSEQLSTSGMGQVEPGNTGGVVGPQTPSLGPAYVLLRAALGDRIPSGPLGPDNVPSTVLTLPVTIAIEELVQHRRTCHVRNCPHVPAPLWPYMRPEAIRGAREAVYKVLWRFPQHGLVEAVRKQVRDQNSELATAISSGSLLQGERLGELLDDLGNRGPRLLAAALWASEFNGPAAELLFRNVVPLAAGAAGDPDRERAAEGNRESQSLKAEVRKARRERRAAGQRAEQAARDLRQKDRALQKSKEELAEAVGQRDELAAQLVDLQRRVQETEAALQSRDRDLQKASRVSGELRGDLQRLQQEQRDLEMQRGSLAQELADERRNVEHLKLRLASIPHGADAIRDVLRAEEERIQRDRTILSGGAKLRADKEWAAYRKLERAFLEAYPEYRKPRPVKLRPKVPLRFVALGGSGEVGRSCYLIEIGERRIVVDCGVKPGGFEDLRPAIDRLERIDALVLTHAHTDHIGWVPALVRRFPEVKIYCSEGTAALMPIMLDDSREHYTRMLAGMRERSKYSRNPEPIVEEYGTEEMEAVPSLALTCGFGEQEVIVGDVAVTLFRAGHILGAASLLIEDQSGRRVFVSGDFSTFPQLTVEAASWPDDVGEVDLLVLESTYGNKDHPPLVDSRNDLVAFVRDSIEKQEGSVILASFGLGRAQELLKLLAAAQSNGDLPLVPVYVDGMIRRINPVYRRLGALDAASELFNEVSGDAERSEVVFNAHRRPCVIVTTSGMLFGGPVVEYASRLLPDPRHRLVLTGYQDETAPSRALLDLTRTGGSRRVDLMSQSGDPIQFEAAMPAKEFSLSAHADRRGLVEYAGRMRPRSVALVHGERLAQEELQFRLSQIHDRAEIACGPAELTVA